MACIANCASFSADFSELPRDYVLFQIAVKLLIIFVKNVLYFVESCFNNILANYFSRRSGSIIYYNIFICVIFIHLYDNRKYRK